jgi:hypothetical protein
MSCREECILPGCWVRYSIGINHIIWSNVWSNLFCLDDLSVDDSGVFMSLTIAVLAFICALRAIRVFLMCRGAPVFGAYMLRTGIFS